ncbi:NAD(P)-binding domain-containing protein [Hyphomonas sp.]|uniref:NAD(P)-binding domain-containing protein n=1 Tax=Hyphomonas sp. TaxID=87 RepID=UPI003526F6FF
MDLLPSLLVYGIPFVLAAGSYLFFKQRASSRAAAIYQEAREAGLTEPTSLHPVIDPALCCGSAACVAACPEGDVIGIIRGKAQLIDPTLCIGHGACAAACPTKAITLVFGTKTRGVELPLVSPDFETSVPGIFVAGELGGMGLIRNAVNQGQQAVNAIHRLRGQASGGMLDLVIVGAGPAGLSASLAAKSLGMRFTTIEQEKMGGTIAHYPRGKVVMTKPAILPIVGPTRFSEISKEGLLEFWSDAISKADLNIEYDQNLVAIREQSGGFLVETSKVTIEARSVLLTIGRRGTPRKLDVPGEHLPKVVYRLETPEQFAGKDILVVGGGDSALEAAASLVEETSARVHLSYRGDAFQRARRKNRERITSAEESGRLKVLLQSNLIEIQPDTVILDQSGDLHELTNDAIIVCAGGVLPTGLLRDMGVTVVTKYGEP